MFWIWKHTVIHKLKMYRCYVPNVDDAITKYHVWEAQSMLKHQNRQMASLILAEDTDGQSLVIR